MRSRKNFPSPLSDDDGQSPFALATPVAAPVTPDKSFAEGWYLAGASQFDGKNFVTVRSKDLSVQFSLYGDERRDDNGVKLQNVQWSQSHGKNTAIIEKDGQFATLPMLETSELGGPAPGAPPPANAGFRPVNNPTIKAPGGLPQPGTAPRPQNVIPRPSVQPVAPQQPNYQITPGAAPNPNAQPPAAAPAGEGRRRIRMINTAPAQ